MISQEDSDDDYARASDEPTTHESGMILPRDAKTSIFVKKCSLLSKSLHLAVDKSITMGELKAQLMALICHGNPDKVWLANKGKLLLNERITVQEAGLTHFSEVEIVTHTLPGGMS